MQNSKSTSVFLVDDDTYSLGLYEQHLTNLGYASIKCFTSGAACIDHLSEKPDIIFLDYNMPPLNGLDALKKIKALRPSTCIVILSGQADLDVAVDSLKCGAFDYILKGENDLSKISRVLEKFEEVQLKNQQNKPGDTGSNEQFHTSNRWYKGK